MSALKRQRFSRMVDVAGKVPTVREAVARAEVELPAGVRAWYRDGELHSPKGPVFQTAVVAGTMAAKRTSELVPLCHPLPVEACEVTVRRRGRRAVIEARVRTTHKTGVEMEALMAVSVAALTVYDMCKALAPGTVIREIRLLEKTGGKRDYR
ncbi:MAG: cyclic pyranopterin monophosphate synthase MoaC, partial [Verrucomicrobiae bacterium]|nr:cyclic pyranopterin monophosphate synthase MoaC [Verrucomicrobiae bacterium]